MVRDCFERTGSKLCKSCVLFRRGGKLEDYSVTLRGSCIYLGTARNA